MMYRLILRALFICSLVAQSRSTTPTTTSSTSTSTSTLSTTSSPIAPSTAATLTTSSAASTSTPPDVLLNVPNLSVGRVELDVDNLQADINLNANVASLVSINAGVAVTIQKVNLTIADVDAQLELIIRLGHLVDIVSRVFESLDLNPSLISAVLNNVTTSVLDPVEVVGANGNLVSSIVGNYLTNMTYTGESQTLQNGLIEKTYSYAPLNAPVNIVLNSAGQVVQATVVPQNGASTATASSSAAPTSSTAVT